MVCGRGCVSTGLTGILRCLLFCSGFTETFTPLFGKTKKRGRKQLQANNASLLQRTVSLARNSFRSLNLFSPSRCSGHEFNKKGCSNAINILSSSVSWIFLSFFATYTFSWLRWYFRDLRPCLFAWLRW